MNRINNNQPLDKSSTIQTQNVGLKNVGKDLIVFMDRKLGNGAFGVVYEGVYTEQKESGQMSYGREVAVKVIQRKNVNENALLKELQVLSRIKHPNIVEFIKQTKTENCLYQVFELVRGGDLKQKLDKKKRFTEFETQAIFYQFGQALSYLHKENIVHRDLKPANIMINQQEELKMTDFGTSRIYNQSQEQLMETQAGTPYYQAPEILLSQPYNEKADLWSVGIILYQMLTGNLPFPARNIFELTNKVMACKYDIPADLSLSDECISLLTKLIITEPSTRMSFQEFEKHNFIKLSPQEYQEFINNPKPLDKSQGIESQVISDENSSTKQSRDELTQKEWDHALLYVKSAVEITVQRMQKVEKLVKSFESLNLPKQNQLKLLIFNLCREAQQIILTFLNCQKFIQGNEQLTSLAKLLTQHSQQENSNQNPHTLNETVLQIKFESGFNEIKIIINDFLLGKLVQEGLQALIVQLCHDYKNLSELLSDFYQVIPILIPELYNNYAQNLIDLCLVLAQEASDESTLDRCKNSAIEKFNHSLTIANELMYETELFQISNASKPNNDCEKVQESQQNSNEFQEEKSFTISYSCMSNSDFKPIKSYTFLHNQKSCSLKYRLALSTNTQVSKQSEKEGVNLQLLTRLAETIQMILVNM